MVWRVARLTHTVSRSVQMLRYTSAFTQLLSSIKSKGLCLQLEGVGGAEADTSRHVSPGCALAGTSYFCWRWLHQAAGRPAHVLYSSGSWENPESPSPCPLSSSLAHESPLQRWPQDWSTVHQLSFTAWNWENLKSTRKTLFCPITPHLPSPHEALGGADSNQNSKQGVECGLPLTASPITDSWVSPVPATSSLHTTATQTNPGRETGRHLPIFLTHLLSPSSHCLLRSLSSATSFPSLYSFTWHYDWTC